MARAKCGVYKITCLTDGKFYIGSSKNIKRRWKTHVSKLNKNEHDNMFLQEAWNLYGEKSFTFEILEETSEECRYELEQLYLDELKPYYRTGVGYNINENALKENDDGIKIYRKRFRHINPFYKVNEEQIKMSKQIDDLGFLIYEEYLNSPSGIDVEHKYVWLDINDGCCYVSYPKLYGGRKVRKVDIDDVDSNSREDLLFMLQGLDAFEEIKSYALESGEDADDWE